MSYIITNGEGSYYKTWTGIGPAFTKSLEEAKRFEDKMEACSVMGNHSFAFTLYDIKEE